MHAFDKLLKCDHTTNNITESWNAWLGDMKKAPIISLMEHIRNKIMQAIIERKMECLRWPTEVPPYINNKMNKLFKTRKFYRVKPTSEVLFEVKDINMSYMVNNKKSYVVNLGDHTCDYEL